MYSRQDALQAASFVLSLTGAYREQVSALLGVCHQFLALQATPQQLAIARDAVQGGVSQWATRAAYNAAGALLNDPTCPPSAAVSAAEFAIQQWASLKPVSLSRVKITLE